MIRTVLVAGRSGLHLRAAARIADAAAALPTPVTVRTLQRPPVPADSMLALVSLGALCGTELILEADGQGAAQALADLADLFATDGDEPGAMGGAAGG
ncbi:HPr family phosphocarrier protein [Actinoplanes sp. N902-109]|uniref:HPr family phosphocarrier protein n=1 Tax=Actinoplanes sp. (strain N902-109) TaxID=649831 RepID=UPI0003295246|nr:HPr family phosphocarrier protein [Actinoplanes sp. N902-109]AGL14177.1 phosphotransferase system, phosphocarrier protein HPr [Actinoplanes sp. N902-109]